MPMLPASLKVLVVEDDRDTRDNLRDIIELDQMQVACAGTLAEALKARDWSGVDIIILDRRLPDGFAEDYFPRFRQCAPHAAIIVITGHDDLKGAVEALRAGAEDYLLKPVDADLLRKTLSRAAERLCLRKEKQRSDAAFRNLVEAAGCVILIVREDGRIAFFNNFAEELTGYSAAEAVGADCIERLIPPSQRAACREVFQRVLSGSAQRHYESALVCRDGTHRTLIWNLRLLQQDSDDPRVLVVGQDISTLKEAQEKLLRSERLAAIGQMVTGLSHESRNALQRIQACLEMLQLEVEDRPKARDLVTRIERAQDQLHKLFEEVRNYAAPIQLERRRVPLREVWREAWECLGAHRSGRQAVLRDETADGDLQCEIDRFRMVQVFRNLLENSLGAGGDSVEIGITCTAVRHGGREVVRVGVRDNGPGLTPEQRKRIFEPFYTTKTHGTGLGIPIAQRIVEAHGGELLLGNGEPPGLEVIVLLPRCG